MKLMYMIYYPALRKMENIATYFIGDIIAGGSAEKTDMSTGDRIVSINGTTVTGMKNGDVVQIVKQRLVKNNTERGL